MAAVQNSFNYTQSNVATVQFARLKWSFASWLRSSYSRLPKKKKSLPPNVLNAIEKWAIKNCNTNESAEKIMDARIKRVSQEIQDTWTEKEEAQHKVVRDKEYLPPMYVQICRNRKQEKKYEPDEQE